LLAIAAAVTAALFATAGPVWAQKLARDSLFNRGELEDLLQESKDRHRFLIIFYVGANMPDSAKRDVEKMRDRTFRSPTFGLWLRWHGTMTEVNQAERPKQFALIQNELRRSNRSGFLGGVPVDWGAPPRILVFKDGRLVRILPDPTQDGEKYKGPWRGASSENRFVSPAGLLLRLDMLMDGLSSTDPVWLARHNHDNPPPEAPARKYWSLVEDANAPAIEDPGAPEGEPPDVLAVLDEARATKRARELFDATGLYTWLWERGAEVDPAFEAARVTLLPDEIGDLCSARRSARDRFGSVFDETSNRGVWVDWHERYAWMVLGARVGRTEDFIEVFDFLTDDIDEAPITPREDRAITQELTRRDPAADPWRLPRNGPRSVIAALDGGATMKQTGKTWQELKETRRWLAGIEARRVYAAYLKAGRDAEAAEIGAALVDRDDDGPTRVSLVMTALAFGQVREDHLRLLNEAAAKGLDRPTLRRRVTEKLEGLAPLESKPGPGDARSKVITTK